MDFVVEGKSSAEMVKSRASELIPLLRERAGEIDRLGMLPPDVLAALDEAGVFKIGVPTRFGGFAPVSARDRVEILVELGKGNGSAAWLAWVSASHPAFVCAIGEEAAAEVFSTTHVGPLLAGSLIHPGHSRGKGRLVDGGYMVLGSWMFPSAVRHCAWLLGGVSWVDADGVDQRGVAILPGDALAIADDWHVEGMKGTNTNSASIEDEIFVPGHRVMPYGKEFFGRLAEVWDEVAIDPFPTAIALGCAHAAIECFIDRAKRRSAWSTPYAKLADMASTQITVAKVRAEIGLVEAALLRGASLADQLSAGELELDATEQATLNFEKVHCAHRLRAATEELRQALGASTAALDDELGRSCRDIRVLCLQGILRHDWAAEALGKGLLDVAPVSPMLSLDSASFI